MVTHQPYYEKGLGLKSIFVYKYKHFNNNRNKEKRENKRALSLRIKNLRKTKSLKYH